MSGVSQNKSIFDFKQKSKTCNQCKLEKDISDFRIDKSAKNSKYTYYKNKCLKCEALNKVEYRKLESSKEIRRKYEREYYKKKRKEDPSYKLRKDIPSVIRRSIKRNDHSSSIWKYLPYTPQQLKNHLEKQFDSNMSWKNHGSYWHIDHIKPQIALEYDTIDHPNFLYCWDLTLVRQKSPWSLAKGDEWRYLENNLSFSKTH